MSLFKKKKGNSDKSLLLADKRAPFNYVESYKTLRTNLNFIANVNEYKKIVITSTAPDEQKSNVCINLAYMLAAAGHKVCVVDCDFRKPEHHNMLRLGSRGKGLSGVLSGNSEIKDALFWVKDIGIYSLPCGPIPPNPSELIASPKMEIIFAALEQSFDYIIIDSPPASVVSDAIALGHLADGVLFVVKHDYMDKKLIKATKEKLEQNEIRILGTVMTGYDVSKSSKKGSNYIYSYEYVYGEEDD